MAIGVALNNTSTEHILGIAAGENYAALTQPSATSVLAPRPSMSLSILQMISSKSLSFLMGSTSLQAEILLTH